MRGDKGELLEKADGNAFASGPPDAYLILRVPRWQIWAIRWYSVSGTFDSPNNGKDNNKKVGIICREKFCISILFVCPRRGWMGVLLRKSKLFRKKKRSLGFPIAPCVSLR
jgi:hypothetical protein